MTVNKASLMARERTIDFFFKALFDARRKKRKEKETLLSFLDGSGVGGCARVVVKIFIPFYVTGLNIEQGCPPKRETYSSRTYFISCSCDSL